MKSYTEDHLLWDNTKQGRGQIGQFRQEQGLAMGRAMAVGQGRRSKERTDHIQQMARIMGE